MKPIFSQNLKYGRFETWPKLPELKFHQANQVHGTEIVSTEDLPCEADGLIVLWDDFSIPLAIKTADCLPVVIEGSKGVVFLHAGWKGLAGNILNRTEIEMIQPENAFIGPSIQECCFEVSEEFKNNFPESAYFSYKNEKLYFNLQAEAKRKLELKFPLLNINMSSLCTCCNKDFNSYRRDKTKERNWNLFLKG
jgi:YfiH family protein